ncbi:conserved protein of unknown function [Candidatus Nitrosocosmicus franklandus]|uniref:Uncharacterized protein n=2 Tax=Candidatus Nitrosocosmicus franklandianus TaxID=1798806 RepID=A0A484I9V1_9ARCH|nr:conserved protein of unknown function [Candidatus Nitrosocosmicus franklandus]
MEDIDPIKNILFYKLIENSIFTPRQIQIIYNFTNSHKMIKNISSGAYYREVRQSKEKLKKICYSIILLDLMNIFNSNQLASLNPIISQLRTLNENHVDYHEESIDSIMDVIDQVVNQVIKM